MPKSLSREENEPPPEVNDGVVAVGMPLFDSGPLSGEAGLTNGSVVPIACCWTTGVGGEETGLRVKLAATKGDGTSNWRSLATSGVFVVSSSRLLNFLM